MDQLHLSAFDIKQACKRSFTAVLIGSRGSGKSVLIQDIMYYLAKTNIPRVCAFSATEGSNGFFSKHVPGTFIFGIDDVEKKLEDIVKSQKRLLLRQRIGEIDKNIDTRIAIILDDVAYKKDVLSSPIVRQIFLNGRHDFISFAVTVQHCMLLRPELRANSDFIFVFKQTAASNIKSLYVHFFGMFLSQKDFSLVLASCAQNYGCLVLDNTMPSTDISKIVFWYKATPGRNFRIGSKEFWAFHEKWFISDEDRYIQERNMQKNGIFSKKKDSVVLKKKKRR